MKSVTKSLKSNKEKFLSYLYSGASDWFVVRHNDTDKASVIEIELWKDGAYSALVIFNYVDDNTQIILTHNLSNLSVSRQFIHVDDPEFIMQTIKETMLEKLNRLIEITGFVPTYETFELKIDRLSKAVDKDSSTVLLTVLHNDSQECIKSNAYKMHPGSLTRLFSLLIGSNDEVEECIMDAYSLSHIRRNASWLLKEKYR